MSFNFSLKSMNQNYFTLFLILLNFMLISLTALFSLAKFDLFLKQTLFWFIGFILFFSFKFFDYRLIFERYQSFFIISFSLFLLFIMLFLPGRIKSWINFGPFSFQPSEFSKLAFFIILANFLSYYYLELNKPIYFFLSFFLISPFLILISLQPDFGMVFLYLLIWFFTIIFFLSKRTILILFFIFLIFSLIFWFFVLKDYQKKRIADFIFSLKNPLKTEYNLRQIRLSLATSSFLGKGVGNSDIGKYGFLPSAHTDFILTFIIEERGYFGYLLYSFLFFLLIKELVNFFTFNKNHLFKNFIFVCLIYFLVKFSLTSLINFGAFPIIGLPVPFLSYGGSHLIFDMWLLGILISISKEKV